jgi:hypothetical protein
MTTDTYTQVAPDNVSGKKISMEQIVDGLGNTALVERANIVGDSGEAIQQLLAMNRAQLMVLRAIHRVLSETSNSQAQEDDFNIGQEIQ